MTGLLILILAALVLAAYVMRRSPARPLEVTETYDQDRQLAGGFVAVRPFDGVAEGLIEQLTQIALATPRTVKTGEAPLTFVTRSKVMGFPDVTQIWFNDGMMTVHAHLSYGKSDFGVNRARVECWLEQLGPLTKAD